MALDEVEELLRLATPGSVPWGQGMVAYHPGMLLAGRIEALLASIDRLRDVSPASGAAGCTSLAVLCTERLVAP